MLRDFHDNNVDGVVHTTAFTLDAFNSENIPHRRLSYTKNRFYSIRSVLIFRKKSILTPLFNEQILWFRQSGLISFWYSFYVDDRRIKSKQGITSNLQIETINELLKLCAVMYFISFVVFILEVFGGKLVIVKHIIDFFTY